MNRKLETIVVSSMAVLLLASVMAFASQTKVKGMISGRTGERLIVRLRAHSHPAAARRLA